MDGQVATERMDELEKRIEKLEKLLLGAEVPVSKVKKLAAKEFLMRTPARSDVQKVLTLGYFLEYVEGMTSFNVSDLEAAFRAAKEKLPTNINDAVNKNIAQGFLMEAEAKKDSRKAWYLTSTGEKRVGSALGE
jgi:hypothetical protein